MKIMNAVPGETDDQRIIRCANNLIKAVLASGRSIHSSHGLSGLDVDIFDHDAHRINVKNILSGWEVQGRTPLKITFAPDPDELVEDDGTEA